MGSFNTECFLSKQIIAPGDPAYLIPITQNQSIMPVTVSYGDQTTGVYAPFHSTCYANAFWVAAAPMISAVYDDYGRFEIDDTEKNKEAIRYFFENTNFCKTEPGRNSSHDLAFDPVQFDKDDPIGSLNAAWDVMVHETRVFEFDAGRYIPVQMCVVSESAYNLASEEYFNCLDGDPYCNIGSIDDLIENVIKEIRERESKFDMSDSDDAAYFRLFGRKEALRDAFYSSSSFRILFHNYFQELSEVDLDQLATHSDMLGAAKLNGFLGFLGLVNAKLSPMVYAGQDYQNDAGALYAKFVLRTSAVVCNLRSD